MGLICRVIFKYQQSMNLIIIMPLNILSALICKTVYEKGLQEVVMNFKLVHSRLFCVL